MFRAFIFFGKRDDNVTSLDSPGPQSEVANWIIESGPLGFKSQLCYTLQCIHRQIIQSICTSVFSSVKITRPHRTARITRIYMKSVVLQRTFEKVLAVNLKGANHIFGVGKSHTLLVWSDRKEVLTA